MKKGYKKPNLESKYYHELYESLPPLEGKTIVITGTTSGTGYTAAEACGKLGAKVVLLNRPSERAKNSFEKLKETTSNGSFHSIDCDLQSFAAVRECIPKINELCSEGIDVLCNNAGVMALEDMPTGDGYDIQMQTNHLSHFLLTKLLWPLLEKAANEKGEARVVNHSSGARHSVKKLEPQFLEQKGGSLGGNGKSMFFGGGRWIRYGQTKLANAAYTAAMHEKLQNIGSKIKAIVAHPGLAETDLQNTTVKEGGLGRWFTAQFMKFGQSQEDGTMGILRGIADPSIESGTFIGPKGMKGLATTFKLEAKYDNPETREMIWKKSCEAVGEDFTIT